MPQAAVKPDLCNCLAIRKAARHVTQHYDRALAPAGLRTTQYSILVRLMRSGPRTINELADDLAMDRTTMGRNIRPLERDGLVAIATDAHDRRRRALSVTETGRARCAAAAERWREAQARFDEIYGAEQALALRTTLAGVLACDFQMKPDRQMASEGEAV
ncbi:MAG TPA: MarR family winged helix-turn-helix transcriptional regulator [Enterovirga sp.]|jgi:DNA-binding MarR family transcriptional regulator|nr:MarR family winged helix-turn-helix transcriptional regulator [Enterovirga sp.]